MARMSSRSALVPVPVPSALRVAPRKRILPCRLSLGWRAAVAGRNARTVSRGAPPAHAPQWSRSRATRRQRPPAWSARSSYSTSLARCLRCTHVAAARARSAAPSSRAESRCGLGRALSLVSRGECGRNGLSLAQGRTALMWEMLQERRRDARRYSYIGNRAFSRFLSLSLLRSLACPPRPASEDRLDEHAVCRCVELAWSIAAAADSSLCALTGWPDRTLTILSVAIASSSLSFSLSLSLSVVQGRPCPQCLHPSAASTAALASVCLLSSILCRLAADCTCCVAVALRGVTRRPSPVSALAARCALPRGP